MTLLIIDADLPLYQALTNAEHEVEFEEDMWMLTSDHREARSQFNDRIEWLMKISDAADYILCFSDSENFRKDVYPEYKSNRKKVRKPLGFKDFKAEVIEQYNSIVKPRLEADDCVGILATKNPDSIIFSEDKDLKQIPGKHLVLEEIEEVTEEEGDRFHLLQTLTGDPVDGYPGCPGIGKVKAERMLQKSPTWATVVEAYEAAGLKEADALVQARCARILRVTDWNNDKKEPILWEPPTTSS